MSNSYLTNRCNCDKLNTAVPQRTILPPEHAGAQHIQSREELNFSPLTAFLIFTLVIAATAFACLALFVPALSGPRWLTETKLLPYVMSPCTYMSNEVERPATLA
jgi:hypothetical protein